MRWRGFPAGHDSSEVPGGRGGGGQGFPGGGSKGFLAAAVSGEFTTRRPPISFAFLFFGSFSLVPRAPVYDMETCFVCSLL